MALANAMPAEKYGWRPGEGVRSVGEVFNHVASANYFFPTLWGGTVPAGVDPQSLEKAMSGDKAKTIDTLTEVVRQRPPGDQRRAGGRPQPEDQDLRPRRHRPRRHDDRRHPRPRAPGAVDRLRPLERRRAAVERQGGLGPHHPGPLLPALPPSRTGRRGRSQQNELSPLPVREGGRGRERGRGEGSEGSGAPLSQPLAVQPVHRQAQGLEAAALADVLGLDLQRLVEIDVVDHRRPPELLLRVPAPALAVGDQVPAGGQEAADLGLRVLKGRDCSGSFVFMGRIVPQVGARGEGPRLP